MNKKDFYYGMYEYLKKTIDELNEIEALVNETRQKMDSRTYSQEHKTKTFAPMLSKYLSQQRKLKEAAEIRCERLCNELLTALEMRTYDPAELTDDVKILSLGVKMSAVDLEKIFDRNAGNYTMEKLIFEYAKRNNVIDFRRVPHNPDSEVIAAVKQIPNVCKYTIKNYSNSEFFDKFWGENSDIRATFFE